MLYNLACFNAVLGNRDEALAWLAKAVDGVDLRVARGEVLGVVGESGCGKSVTALSIMRLVAPPGRVESGEILFEGRNLLDLSDDEIAAIMQDHQNNQLPRTR